MNYLAALLIGFATISTVGLGPQSTTKPDSLPRGLIKQYIGILNSGDKAKTKAFVQFWYIPNGSIDQRVQRMIDLAKNGGPFKYVGDGKETAEEVDAFVVDKDGSKLAFRLHIESSPKLMIAGLQIQPAFMVEGATGPSPKWRDLQDLAASILKESKSPGIGIAMIRNGVGQVVVSGLRSVNGPDLINPNDIWSVGSIGKPICTAVIGKLIEQGKLSWGETLPEALSGYQMVDGYRKVTLQQLMMHRGGIPEDLGFTKREVDEIVGSAKTPVEIRTRYARNILSRNPISAPGTTFAYSNAGYALLSHIAERVTGVSYESLVRSIVFRPLGLTHSYTGADKLPIDRPHGHVQGPKGLTTADFVGPMESMFAGAGGGIYMSVADLARFGQAQLVGLNHKDGFLKASTVVRLHEGLPEEKGGLRLYACGWGIEKLPGMQEFHGHNGSNGTMRAELAIFPGAGLVVAAAVNRGGESDPSPGLQAVIEIGRKYAPAK